jgi:hypothetical protein
MGVLPVVGITAEARGRSDVLRFQARPERPESGLFCSPAKANSKHA